ncbi:MerR family transcriptional regulator [Tsukamurella sp. 8F]|uniref:MerR family transcriptional regulator n=1 Tax=unclassified Tsukamurella TaxID=2633480 RepID=UPI0023B8D68B|nr:MULTISPECIES: MerR family transcriptional regulator [unclassified Tsukamurella]MDF0530193.1 MerR family transcriptional regulator [Tsukamurella sp. 8J]MDF0586510.1 MerR family transcriptional regulator [Tsukamurella sp. 8F]
MRIGELAERTGTTTRALRYYEEQGLLTTERSSGGQRWYGAGAVNRVLTIRQLFAAGLSSRTIAELTPCIVDGRATTVLLERLAVERDRIDEHIAQLTATRDRLEDVIDGAAENLRTGEPCGASRQRGTTAARSAPNGRS